MSYTPTEWGTGDTITAALLNKMENGIAAGGGGGGYDAEVSIVVPSGSSAQISIVSGTYASLAALMTDGASPNILVRYWDVAANNGWASSTVSITYWSSAISVPFIDFNAAFWNADLETMQCSTTIGWNSEDEVFFDD